MGVSVVGGNADGGYNSGHPERTNGGGICSSGILTIAACSFLGNAASNYGGGIYNREGSLVVENSVFSGNSAGSELEGGGAIWNNGTSTIADSTFAGNSALAGAGISSHVGEVTLINSIVALNGNHDIFGTFSQESTNNIIGIDPGFVRDPGTNGPDDYGDLRLRAESAAIDVGNSEKLPADIHDLDQDGDTEEPLSIDLDGNPRVFGDSIDIGAFEFQSAPAGGRESASAVVTTSSDSFDLFDGQVSLREAIYYTWAESCGEIVTFAPQLSGSTILLDGVPVSLDAPRDH